MFVHVKTVPTMMSISTIDVIDDYLPRNQWLSPHKRRMVSRNDSDSPCFQIPLSERRSQAHGNVEEQIPTGNLHNIDEGRTSYSAQFTFIREWNLKSLDNRGGHRGGVYENKFKRGLAQLQFKVIFEQDDTLRSKISRSWNEHTSNTQWQKMADHITVEIGTWGWRPST